MVEAPERDMAEKTHDESHIEMGNDAEHSTPASLENEADPIVTPKTWFVVAVSE